MTQTQVPRRSRSRVLVWTVLLIAAVPGTGAVSYLVYSHRRQQNTRMLLQRARDARADGDLAAATASFRQYLQRQRDDRTAFQEYADVLWHRLETEPAVLAETARALQRLIAQTPDDTDALARLTELYIQFKEFERAQELATRGLELQPSNADAAIALARAHFGAQEIDNAIDVLAAALDRTPDEPRLYALAVQLLVRKNRTDDAAGLLEKAKEKCPPHEELDLAAYYLSNAIGKEEEARAHLQRALDAAPDSLKILLPAAVHHITEGRFARAHEILEHSQTIAPDDRRVALAQAELAERRGDRGSAVAAAQRLKAFAGDYDVTLLLRAADLFLRFGELEQVDECLARLDAIPGVRKSADAAALTNALKGSRALRAGEPWRAVPLLREARKQRPESANVARALATVHLEAGDPDAAAEVLDELLRRTPEDADARWRLAEIAWKQGRIERAQQLADAAPPGPDEEHELAELVKLACALRHEGHAAGTVPDDVRSTLTQLASAPPPGDAAFNWLVRALVYGGLRDVAIATVTKHLDGAGATPKTAMELGELLIARDSEPRTSVRADGRREEPARSLELANALRKRFPEDPHPYILQIRSLAAGGRLSDAAQVVDQAPFADAAKAPLFETLGDAYLSEAQMDAALDAFRRASEADAANISARLKIIWYTPRLDEALARTNELKSLEGEAGLRWKHARAAALLRLAPDDGSVSQAVELLEECVAQRPAWSKPRLLLGHAMERLQRPDEAIAAYRAAIEREPALKTQPIAVRLAELLERVGRFDEAEALLVQITAARKATEHEGAAPGPDEVGAPADREPAQYAATTARILRLRMQQLLRRQRFDRAAETAEKLIALTPDDPALLATAAGLYLRLGQPARAETHARRACAYDPASSNALSTLAAAVVNQGRFDEAVTLVTQAAENGSQPRHWLLLAGLLAFRQQTPAAVDAVRRAEQLAGGEADVYLGCAEMWAALGRRGEQLAAIQRAIEIAGENPDESLPLARALAASPERADRDRARGILTRRLDADSDDAPTLVLAARLELVSDAPDLQGAKRHVERALLLTPEDPQARALLASIHARDARFQAALSSAEVGLATDPDNVELLVTAAQIYCHQGRFQNAIPLLTRALRARPHLLEAARLLAVAFRESGRADEAFATLAHLKDADQRSADGLQILAELYEATHQLDRAKELFVEASRLDEASAASFQNLLRFYGRVGNLEKVYQLAQQREAEFPADVQSRMVAAHILAGNATTPDVRETGLRWLDDVAERSPTHAAEALLRAGLALYKQQELRRAEAKLETALEHEPMNREAVNALAWLYAVDMDRERDAREIIDRYLAAGGHADPQLLDTHAKVLLELGEYEEAKRRLEACLERVGYTSTKAAAHFHLGIALRHLGRTDEALPYVREALRLSERLGGLTPGEKQLAQQLVRNDRSEPRQREAPGE